MRATATRAATTYRTGEKGVNRVRTYSDAKTGMYFLEYRDGQGRKARTALGHRDFEKAKEQADTLAARLRQPKPLDADAISLGALFDNYLREVTPTKGKSKQGHDRRTAALLLDILGSARKAVELTHRDAARFVAERKRRGDLRNGEGVKGQAIGNRVIGYDLQLLKTVLTWGVNSGLLRRNPLAGYKVPAEKSPRRPVVTGDQFEALLGVSEQISPTLRTALVLAH